MFEDDGFLFQQCIYSIDYYCCINHCTSIKGINSKNLSFQFMVPANFLNIFLICYKEPRQHEKDYISNLTSENDLNTNPATLFNKTVDVPK